MQCVNCSVSIDHKFKFAIKYNKCPACDKQIMDTKRLAAYVSLTELLKENTNIKDIDEVVNLIVTNFEVKQLFNVVTKIEEPKKEVAVEVEEDIPVPIQKEKKEINEDEEHKKQQMARAKKQLKEMRNEVYEDALRGQYGMETEGGDLFGIGSDPKEIFGQMERDQDMEKRKKKMLSGAGGFRRTE